MNNRVRGGGDPRGFSLIEVLFAVAILGVMASIGGVIVAQNRDKVARQKLELDVRTINSAIQVFRVSGGSLKGISSPAMIVSTLQADTEAVSAEQTAGLTGHRLDPRLVVRMQTTEEASTGEPRAHWNATEERFEIAYSGPVGVKFFEMNEAHAAEDRGEVTLTPTMKLAVEDPWIWDYNDVTPPGGTVMPTPVPVHPGKIIGPPSTTPPPTGPPPAMLPLRLTEPVFSIPSGRYPIADFDLQLQLNDPNPEGVSEIRYSVNGATWSTYTDGTSITVAPGSRVVARAESLSPEFYASRNAKKTYRARDQKLEAPVINMTASRFDHGANATVNVELVNPNDPAVSKLQYRVNRENWQDYSGWLALSAASFPKGVKVRGRAVPTAEHYTKSSTVERIIQRPPPTFSGSTLATYSNPSGGSGLVTNLGPGEEGPYFFWGTAYHSGQPPSSLNLTDRAFSGVQPEERFVLATMDYFNGTIRGRSGADSVQLEVELSFDSGQVYDFDFTLNLINTPNSGVTPEEAADIVQLAALASSSTATINGEEFYLVLEFGETSANGFSEVNEFHVLEDASATGDLYATLIPASNLDGEDPYYFGDDIFLDEDPDPELAPILLALDSTIFYPGLSSIRETAEYKGLDPGYLLNDDLVTRTGNPWLRWSEELAGDEILIPGASLSPHGWFSLPSTASWSAEDFALGNVPEADLRGTRGAKPLVPQEFLQMNGRQVVAVVYDKELRYNSRRNKTNLRGNRRGRLAFTIVGLESTGELSETSNSNYLWDVRIRIDSPFEPSIYDLDLWSPPTVLPPTPSGGEGSSQQFISV